MKPRKNKNKSTKKQSYKVTIKNERGPKKSKKTVKQKNIKEPRGV